MADPALVELAISAASDQPARALRLLGFAADLPVRAAASARRCAGPPRRPGLPGPAGQGGRAGRRRRRAGHHRPGGAVPGRRPRRRRRGRQPRAVLGAGPGSRCASPPRAGRSSTTTTWARWRCWRGPSRRRAGQRRRGRGRPPGRQPRRPQDPGRLLPAGYARRAAALLHLHRSTVARRLGQLGKALGTDLTQPTGLLRATLALTTWQLLNDRSRQRHQASETTGQTEPRPPPASSQ
jgi:PucR C-terminal helix-turn-helix domain